MSPLMTDADMIEAMAWRKIDGWPYSVSSCGRVRNDRTGRVLRPSITQRGYERVRLQHDCERACALVARLVAGAWIGDASGLTVNHKDGNKRNNHYTNLEIVTSLENIKHAATLGLLATGRAHGRHTCPSSVKRGSANGLAKLTESDVAKIREITTHRNGRILARQFDVSPSAISLIRRGKSWKHVR